MKIPNNTQTNAAIKSIINFINAFIQTIKAETKRFNIFILAKAVAKATYMRAIKMAYYVWSLKGIANVNGYTYRSGMADSKSSILVVVYIVIAFLVATILFPIAMQQVTSAVTTSWNSAVSTSYATLLPVLVIVALVIHFVGII